MDQSKPGGNDATTKTGDHAADAAPDSGADAGAAGEAKPMGTPTSDRHHSETASTGQGGDADIAKHDHGTD